MRGTLERLKSTLSDPTKTLDPKVKGFVRRAIATYERAVKASIGMPTYSDSSTLQSEARADIPTLPLSTYQLIERTCLIEKLASLGTTAGGFYASLTAGDLGPFTGTNKLARVKSVTSWTVPKADGTGQTSFAGVSVPAATGSTGDNILPIWSENWTPIGQGFPGIKTLFPLGDFPLYSAVENTIIVNHFTALGGTNGPTGIPVVFHVVIETLI